MSASSGSRDRVPGALVVGSLLLSVIGLGTSTYLAVEHFTGTTSLACPESSTINCLRVTTSAYSWFAGIPVSLLGVGFFVASLALMSPPAWASPVPEVRWSRIALVTAGVLFASYLVWVEVHRLDAVCLWCTVVHVVTLLLFFVVSFAEALREPAGSSSRQPLTRS